jgi:hypothetical protein
MYYLQLALQVLIALGIYNVWLLRFNRSTSYRGGQAKNLTEEFAAYGLSKNFMYVIGFLKLLFATLLLIGIWFGPVIYPAAAGMALLMIGAIAMHFKVKDPLLKSLPAAAMLVMSVLVVLLQKGYFL